MFVVARRGLPVASRKVVSCPKRSTARVAIRIPMSPHSTELVGSPRVTDRSACWSIALGAGQRFSLRSCRTMRKAKVASAPKPRRSTLEFACSWEPAQSGYCFACRLAVGAFGHHRRDRRRAGRSPSITQGSRLRPLQSRRGHPCPPAVRATVTVHLHASSLKTDGCA
jgi:hypothetical protein